MKMRPRPYNAIRYYYWGEEFVLGDASDAHNLMGSYDEIRLNLPGRGMSEFDPLLPRVMKWRSELGVVAGDVVTFVDDVRVTGYCSKENCRNARASSASLQVGFSIWACRMMRRRGNFTASSAITDASRSMDRNNFPDRRLKEYF